MESPQNKSSSILGNCLGCQGLVRIPATASVDSKVRCPHCNESFSLTEMLEQNAPEMEIVGEDKNEATVPHADRTVSREAADEMPSREKFIVPPQLSRGARRRRRRRRSEDDRESSSDRTDRNNDVEQAEITRRDRGEGRNGSTEESSHFEIEEQGGSRRSSSEGRRESSGSRSSSRHASDSRGRDRSSRGSRKKHRERPSEASSGVEFLKIAIGGVLAFPIAYLLVLWVFNQDPLGLGPSIGKVAPFAIPEALRVESVEGEETPAADSESDSNESDEKLPIPDVDPDKVRVNEIE